MIKADIILQGNQIFTGERFLSGSIMIKDGKIMDILPNREVEPYIGTDTKVFSFEDETILPGFHDFHIHLTLGCLFDDYVNLSKARSARETA